MLHYAGNYKSAVSAGVGTDADGRELFSSTVWQFSFGMFSGQLLAMPVFTIILNVLYIGCRYVITCMISTIGYGMANSYADRMK